MVNVAGAVVLLGLAGVLLSAAAAKTLAAWRGRLSWPDPTLAGIPIPAGVVILAEAGAAIAVLAVAAPRPAAIVLAAGYGALSVAAWRLRGKTCGCFGLRSSMVGPGHVAATIVACGASLVLSGVMPGGWAMPIGARAATMVAVAATVLVVATMRGRRAEARDRAAQAGSWDPAELTAAAGIAVVTKPDCPHCAMLRVLLDGMVSDRVLHWITLSDNPDEPARADSPADRPDGWLGRLDTYTELAAGHVPCAIAVDQTGTPVAEPRWGTPAGHRLVETFLRTRHPQPTPVVTTLRG